MDRIQTPEAARTSPKGPKVETNVRAKRKEREEDCAAARSALVLADGEGVTWFECHCGKKIYGDAHGQCDCWCDLDLEVVDNVAPLEASKEAKALKAEDATFNFKVSASPREAEKSTANVRTESPRHRVGEDTITGRDRAKEMSLQIVICIRMSN